MASVALALFAGLRVSRHAAPPRPAGDPLVAVVNDTLIHQSDLRVLSPPVSAQEATGLLVDFALLDQEAKKKNVTVSDAEMQQQRRSVMGDQTGRSYAEAAQTLGRTPAGLDLQLRHVVLLSKLAALKADFPIGRMFHARGLLVRSHGKHAASDTQARAFAAALQARVAAGADIAALARADSDDAESAADGGDFGIIQLAGAPNLVRFAPDFKLQLRLAGLVKTATVGVLPGPFHGDLGYWVVKIISTSDAPRADTAQYRQVQQMWGQIWTGRMEPQVMARLRSSAVIQPPLAPAPPQPMATGPSPGPSPTGPSPTGGLPTRPTM